ncbi:MAG: family 10 glycosylhydrolase [SAR324 cluster bacterium]|nr:family 10 glycosylhydrolase [SAR324 cluster bacterium]
MGDKFLKIAIVTVVSILAGCVSKVPLEERHYYAQNYDKPADDQFSEIIIDDDNDVPEEVIEGVDDDKDGVEQGNETDGEASDLAEEGLDEGLEEDLVDDLADDLTDNQDSLVNNGLIGLGGADYLDTGGELGAVNFGDDNLLIDDEGADKLIVADELIGETTEQKMFFAILRLFRERNQIKFLKFSDAFLESYPESQFTNQVEKMRDEFFHHELFDRKFLKQGTIEISELNFDSWIDFREHLGQLKQYNLKRVIFTPFQNPPHNLVPFTHSNSGGGTLFASQHINSVNNTFKTFVSIVKDVGLSLYIKLPMRDHSWLNFSYSELMDQTWDPIRKKTNYNLKLNLLHDNSLEYLLSLVGEIAKYDIDGIIIDDDYVFSINEGLSDINLIAYNAKSEHNFSPLDISEKLINGNFAVNQKVSHNLVYFSRWKVSKIHLLLLKMVQRIKADYPLLDVGIEIFPELVNSVSISLYKHAISYKQIIGLPVDFFVLGEHNIVGKGTSRSAGILFKNYQNAAQIISDEMKDKQTLLLKAAYSDDIKMASSLNIYLTKINKVAQSSQAKGIILGPVAHNWQIILRKASF